MKKGKWPRRTRRQIAEDLEADTATLAERLRAEEVRRESVLLAARLGHPAAKRLIDEIGTCADLEGGLKELSARERQLFACDCLERAIGSIKKDLVCIFTSTVHGRRLRGRPILPHVE